MEDNAASASEDARDSSTLDALVALTAFNGVVIGLVASCCAALSSDGVLGLVAASGALVCVALWQRHLVA
jgi:hypothetical protein